MSATFLPNLSLIESKSVSVSSIVSCNNPAAIADASRLIEVKILATSIGCTEYGSPDALFWFWCALTAKL